MRDGPVPRASGAVIPVIVNARAGGGHSEEDVAKLAKLFADAGMAARVQPVGGEELARTARELASHAPIVVAAGGDGTVSAVAGALRGTSTTLGVLPAGTLNHFAKDLGIPTDLDEAVRVIATGREVHIDMGEVNGRPFLNNSSLGLYPDMVIDRERQQRRFRRSKRMATMWALLALLRQSRLLRLRLDIGEEMRDCRSPFVFIGNNEYSMEGFDIGTRERLDAGRLSVYTTQRCTARGLFGLAVRALAGRLRQADDFAAVSAVCVRVESTHRRLLVATDGEVNAMDTPLEFRITPRALRVLVPREEK